MENRTDNTTTTHHDDDHEGGSGGQSGSVGRSEVVVPGDIGARRVVGTLRAQLINAMGLAYDPFSSGVSEKDLAPDFGSIYVDILPGLLNELQRPEASCLFANYGMGKTATRIALEYALRLARSPTVLSVTYTPMIEQQAAEGENSLQRILDAIALDLRIDLLVQYIERLPERDAAGDMALGPLQQQALVRQARSLPTWFSAPMRAALADLQNDSAFWRPLRPVVRYVPVTPGWRALVGTLASAIRSGATPVPSWHETVEDVRSLGFEQIYVLVDAVDEGRYGTDAYLEVVRPLLMAAEDLASQQIYLKFFLPTELKDVVCMRNDLFSRDLTLLRPIATIDAISPADLGELINDRFEAASTSTASFRSLDWLGQELGESVQGRLIESAKGSPRRLIELVSAMIDFHSLNGFRHEERLWLTRAEWQRFLDDVVRVLPPPV